ncbi:MAG: hypothetical protein JNK87_20410 [Bryobacterales bacterium]|nr:hypothetical protein [Bryobacterales bacterium]
MLTRLFLLAVLALATFATPSNAIDIPIPDCSPENCDTEPPNPPAR